MTNDESSNDESRCVMRDGISRRDAMMGAAIGVGAAALASSSVVRATESSVAVKNGRVRQSVCQWCYGKMPVEELAKYAAAMGLMGIDLVGPEHFATLKKYNLMGTMTKSHGIGKGLNRKENWEPCLGEIRKAIEATAEAGYPNVICFSGNREGMADDEGLANCTT